MKPVHLKGGKGQKPHSNKLDGKKNEQDSYFLYNMAILVGCPCEVNIRDGKKFDGIFVSYSAEQHEIMLEAAHQITEEGNDEAPITNHYDALVIPIDKMLSAKFKNVDVSYATRDFVTDQAIASSRGINSRDKELTPWDGPEGNSEEDLSLDGGVSTAKENGWEAKDMFKKNEEKYGVTSSYKHDLAGYTTQLDKSDPDSYKRHEQQANQIAQEIEKNTISWERSELENGEDEEEAFSSVVRPRGASHTVINNNNNNNNNTSAGSDKYIPPSRRQGNVQATAQSMPQNLPMNNNGANQMNNNSGNPRKPIYGQNQNPRGSYGVPPNNMYHDRRNNFEQRRPTGPNQYTNPNSHNEGRRVEDNNRQQRLPNKQPMERRGGGGGVGGSGRDDTSKLKEFSSNFRLQGSDQNQPRRMPQSQHTTPVNVNASIPPSNSNVNISTGPTRNPSPPSISSAKSQKEEVSTPIPASAQQTGSDATDKGNSNACTPTMVPGSNVSGHNSSGIGNVIPSSVNETTPTSGSSTIDNQTPSTGDSKNSDRKKFTFNPDAKEFNPTKFATRSPSTPPRPPSTPAQPSTPQQMMQPQQIHPFMHGVQMQMVYAAQPYTQTAALTPSSNSSASSGGTTPRHGGHRKGINYSNSQAGGMLGVPPRSEMTPPIQMAAGPPLLAPASIQAAAAPHQYAFVPQGHYSQVMRVVPQSVMSVFPTEGGGTAQMHQQVHYIPHNGAPTQNAGGHPNNNTPPNNPSAPTSVVPANGQAYGQAGGNHGGAQHVGYPFVGVPVMNVGYPHGHHHMITVPYVSHHQQGGTTPLQPSQ